MPSSAREIRKSPAQVAWAAKEPGFCGAAATCGYHSATLLQRSRTKQHRAGGAVHLGDHVGAVMHAVREVHVEVCGRAEHHPRSRGRPAECM